MGTMTKKDFVAIARAIDACRRDCEEQDLQNSRMILDEVSRKLALVCASTNPLFDRDRFIAACGVEQ